LPSCCWCGDDRRRCRALRPVGDLGSGGTERADIAGLDSIHLVLFRLRPRLAANTSWIIGAVIALAALALALAAVRVSARRYRQAASALSADEPLPDGTLPAIIVALVLLIGGAAVVFILVEL
jgi:uncharacterized membrane protein